MVDMTIYRNASMKNKLHIDFETYSNLDIKKVGAIRYSESTNTEILIIGYRVNDGPIKLYVPEDLGDFFFEGNLIELEYYLNDPDTIIFAHNANFEYSIINNVGSWQFNWKPVPIERFACTAAMAARMAFPRNLEDAAIAAKLNVKKDPRGTRLISKFCKPVKPTKSHPSVRWWPEEAPEDFMDFMQYCYKDVETESELFHRIEKFKPTVTERQIWLLDHKINHRGIPIDVDSVKRCLKILEEQTEEYVKEFRSITGGINPTQRDKVMQWLEEQENPLPDLQAGTIDSALEENNLTDVVKKALTIRKAISRSSTKKLLPMITAASDDYRVRGTFIYWGAERTGRWSGRLIQPHNYIRPTVRDTERILEDLMEFDLADLQLFYDSIPESISNVLRNLIAAPYGKDFIVADYSAIEARGVCWLANDTRALKLFKEGKDVYVNMASYVYGKPDYEITKDERWLGKQIILGCGYGMSAEKFQDYCAGMGVNLDDDICEFAVKTYRNRYAKVVHLWESLNDAARDAVQYHYPKEHPRKTHGIEFYMEDNFLFMVLPSKRKLCYPYPFIKEKTFGPNKKGRSWTVEAIHFTTTQKKAGELIITSTYGGSLCENAVQAISRDFMANGMMNAEAAGYPVIMTVHDEIVTEVPENTKDVAEFERIICRVPEWGEGMPLAAEGYRAKRYRK